MTWRSNVAIVLAGLVLIVLALVVQTGTAAPQLTRASYIPYVELPATPTVTPIPTPSPTPDPACQTISGQTYTTIPVNSPPITTPVPAQHPDLDLSIRSWQSTNETLGLVNYSGGADASAPQLASSFATSRTPTFSSAHRVYDWDWPNFKRGSLLSNYPVTLLGMATVSGETIHLPSRGAGTDIYQGKYHALVLFASKTRITLRYGRDDNFQSYSMHFDNVCIEPRLLTLYEQSNAAGRSTLPALAAGQPFCTERNGEVLFAIRDWGTFLDPRSRKDWWQGR